MELKKGYKETEVGTIPNDWEVHNIAVNSTMKARIGWQGLTTAEYLSMGDYYLVAGTDFFDGRIKWETCHFVTKDRFEQDRNIQVKQNDILITKDGTIGKVAFIDELPLDATLNSGVFVVRPIDNAYDPKYCYYVFKSQYFDSFLRKLVAGSTINHLYQKDFVSFQFPLPPTKTEQTAIATALSDMDNLIVGQEQLIAKKKAIKQGAMQELLRPKEGWVVQKLGELSHNISSGKSATNSNVGQYPIYGSTGIIGWNGAYDYYGEKILVARVGANAGTLNKVSGNYCVSDNTLIISLHSNIDIDFIFLSLQNLNLNTLVYGSGQPLITGGQLKELEIHHPSNIEMQTELSNRIMDMDKEIITTEKILEKYKLLKQGMMQELLTGKTRLV